MAGEAAISTVVELLGNLLIEKVKFLRGVRGKVELLRDELRRMQSFLRDANNKQYEDEMVRTWISDIRELAHDSQDAIEIFLAKAESRKETSKSKGILGCISSVPKKYYYLNQTGKEIESILARLDAIDKSRERFGIKDLGEAAESAWRLQVEGQRRLDPWQIDQDLVGMEDDIKMLLQASILNEQKKGLSVAVLEGMGGIGKSTLAQAIYNHPDVIAPGQFHLRGWVVVSSDFKPIETIKQLIFNLQASEDQNKKIADEIKGLEDSTKDKAYLEQELRHMLYKQLEGKSYLIVLDDVWEKPHFKHLITAFPNQQDKKNRILVTTRNTNIANPGGYVHKMKFLNSVKSWELLLKKANIGDINGKCPEELEGVGRQILEKCNGLPLAISVVGGLLVETAGRKSGWEQILSQINSYLGRADSSVSAVLELSYINLSPQLKSCFLCLAFFKEDATISTKDLEDIWVAQGLIKREGSGRLDEIARGYLNELINRSMIQIEDLSFDDRVKNCRIHDLVREVCLRKAKEEISLEIVKGEDASSSSGKPGKPRHRVVYGNNLEISKNKHVRSLFLLNVNHDDDYVSIAPTHFWSSFRLLNTLHLEGFAFKTLPDSLGLLIGLKILKIIHSRSGLILEIPSWLNMLKNLEVLTVENASMWFPKVGLEMERLRHLDGFCFTGSKMKNCKSLETLKSIGVEDWVEYSSTVMANCPLRELEIRMYIEPSEWGDMSSRVRASWEKMTNLMQLHLYFISELPLSEAIPQLNSLTTLRVTNLMSTTSTTPASMFPPNLSHLLLDNCSIDDDQLIEIGRLPKLQYLALINGSVNIRRMVVLHDHFPSLQVLYLHHMWELESIDIEQGGMPRLKQLKISRCTILNTENLPKYIIISKAPELVF